MSHSYNNPYARRPADPPFESFDLNDSQNFDEKYSNSSSRQGYPSTDGGNCHFPFCLLLPPIDENELAPRLGRSFGSSRLTFIFWD